MKANLSAPNIMSEIPVGTGTDYIKLCDQNMQKELDNYSPIWVTLERIIALEISRYVLYHIGGERPFDQSTSDSLLSLISEEKNIFKEIYGSDYISLNNDW
jgi:hypothetical protein